VTPTQRVTRVLSEPLGGSPLSLAVQVRQLPPELQPWAPRTDDEWRVHIDKIRSTTSRAWYEALRPAIAPTAGSLAAQNLERVVAENGIVVTTGQQAALFGGPLYTLAKALSALELAASLEARLGVPATAIFWAATDDADFLEASVTYVADADGLHELRLTSAPPAGTPASEAALVVTPETLEQLRRSCASAAYAEYFELTQRAFTSERTLGSAYVRQMRELLEPLGMAVFDSSHPAYLAAARPILTEALQRGAVIAQATAANAAAIRALGFEPQVEDDRGLTLVATTGRGTKQRVPIDEVSHALSEPRIRDTLSPNVLLRPVVEREILPTAAYVAGPAELAYFAQSRAVAEALDRQPPVGVPRWSCTVVEPFAQKALERLGVEYPELRDREALERRLAVEHLPRNVASAWRSLQEDVRRGVAELGEEVRAASLMPAAVTEGLLRSMEHKLARMERRLLAAVKRKEDRIRRDLAVASAALMPLGKRQERVLNFVPMLARSGEPLIEEMRSHARVHAMALFGGQRAQQLAAR